MSTGTTNRGDVWFRSLAGEPQRLPYDPPSILTSDAALGGKCARFLAIVPDPNARFPQARHGEAGLEECCALARHVRDIVELDRAGVKRPLIAIVDVRSQAYGRREEMMGLFLAAAAAVEAYVSARVAGHPVIALVVGQAISGAFLAHGLQANLILALDDDGVVIHAMRREAAARITRRSVGELDALASRILPLSYSIRDYAHLGILHEVISVSNAENPTPADVEQVRQALIAAVADARSAPVDLRCRWESAGAVAKRHATRLVRAQIAAQWHEDDGEA
jgi:malonate decarboxylase gamma subunit